MARNKKNKEINVFSASAIDLFASSLGVFIILVIIIIPFYQNKAKVESPLVQIDPTEHQQLKIKLQELESEIIKFKKVEEDAKVDRKQASLKTQEVESELEKQSKKMAKFEETIEKLEEELKKKVEEEKELKKIVQESNSKMRTLASLKEKQKKSVPIEEVKKLEKEIARNSKEKRKVIEQMTQLRVENRKQKEEIKKQQQQISAAKSKEKSNNPGSFIAIVIKWATQKHDIDLVVTDSKGHVYDFKRRRYEGVPGELALDSRTGPGAEIWQASNIFPGIYSITYKFYNTYGNSEPAVVSGTLFTKSGSKALPKAKLNFTKNRTLAFKVQVDKNQEVSILN